MLGNGSVSNVPSPRAFTDKPDGDKMSGSVTPFVRRLHLAAELSEAASGGSKTDRFVSLYLDYIGLGFALEAVAALVRRDRWEKWFGSLVLSALFLLCGLNWPRIKAFLGSARFAKSVRWVTYASVVITVVTFLALSVIAYLEWKHASLAWKHLFDTIQTIAKPSTGTAS